MVHVANVFVAIFVCVARFWAQCSLFRGDDSVLDNSWRDSWIRCVSIEKHRKALILLSRFQYYLLNELRRLPSTIKTTKEISVPA